MSAYIPKAALPETRLESLLHEKRILAGIDRLLALPPDQFQKLPARTREHLHQFKKEARMKWEPQHPK